MAIVVFAFRLWIGLLLIAASVGKVDDRRGFADAIRAYQIVPNILVGPTALMLPLGEFVAGGALVVGVQLRVVAGLAAVLLVSFACAVSWNLAQGRRFDCGCGTAEDQEISWRLVAKDLGLAAMCVFVAFFPANGLTLWPGATVTGARPVDLIPVAMVVITAAVMLRVVDVVGVRWRRSARGA